MMKQSVKEDQQRGSHGSGSDGAMDGDEEGHGPQSSPTQPDDSAEYRWPLSAVVVSMLRRYNKPHSMIKLALG